MGILGLFGGLFDPPDITTINSVENALCAPFISSAITLTLYAPVLLHECDVLINSLEKGVIKKLKKANPDVVAFSAITGGHKWCLETARKVKAAIKCKTIFGGPHATHFPDIIKYPQVDYVCRGEGEYALLDLADRMKRNGRTDNIMNIWCKKDGKIIKNSLRPLIPDLNELPFSDRGVYYKYGKIRLDPQKRFMTTRGCPYNCTFCFNHALMELYKDKGKYVRRRSVQNVIDEILQVKKKYSIKTVYFEDDTFILDRKWINEFLEEYRKKVNTPFICLIRANLVDEELVKLFKNGPFVY